VNSLNEVISKICMVKR